MAASKYWSCTERGLRPPLPPAREKGGFIAAHTYLVSRHDNNNCFLSESVTHLTLCLALHTHQVRSATILHHEPLDLTYDS